MKRADRQLARQRLEGQGRVLLQQPTGLRHFVDPLLLRIVFIRLAAFAGRNPAATAAATSAKKRTFSRARRERQEGRQQMPVVSTAKTN
jgi:hypothetical protein